MLKNEICLIVKPTHECNLNCNYCYDVKEKETVCNKIVKDETIKAIAEKAFRGFKGINWTWHGGEPLIVDIEKYEKWHEIINDGNSLKSSISFNMQSNGFLLNKEIKQNLKKLNINYSFSYDVINNNKRRNSNLQIYEIDPYSDYNVISIVDFESSFNLINTYEFLKKVKRNVSFNKIFLDNEMKENIKEYTENYKSYYKHIIYDKNPEKKDRSFFSYLNAIFGICGNSSLCSETKCIGSFISINPDGDIFPCDRFGINNGSDYCFGNINDYNFSLLEYKKSDGYKKLNDDYIKLKRKCRECEVSAFCNGGCLANRQFEGKIDVSRVTEEECYFLKEIYLFLFSEIFNLKKEELLEINPFIYEFIFENKVILKFMIDEMEGE